MASYYLTNKAVLDLTHIWDYTFDTWSEKQADKYYNDLIKACAKISKQPNLGKKYFKIFNELRGFQFNHHIVFYRQINSEIIEITRILHEQMDLKNRILE